MRSRSGGSSISLLPIGGPTVLLGYRERWIVIDTTFDPPGEYPVGERKLTKTEGPALSWTEIDPVDIVLLSHDQHPDNFDTLGRSFAESAPVVFTTVAGAERVGANACGLDPWDAQERDGMTITALHCPPSTGLTAEGQTGPVIGFMLSSVDGPTIYISGDNASLDVVEAVAAGVPDIDVAILFAGCARTPLIDGDLTLSSEKAVLAAGILGAPHVLPVHTNGWAHFSEGRDSLIRAFETAHVENVLLDSTPGVRSVLHL